MVPEPTAELRNIGYGVLGGILAVALIVAVMGALGRRLAVVLVRRHNATSTRRDVRGSVCALRRCAAQ